MRRNQYALRAATAPRRPCCSLYSARARSGFEVTQPRRASVEFWLGRSANSFGPLLPSFGIAPTPVANVPTEAAGNEERRFHSETTGAPMKLGKPARFQHQ